MKIFQWLEIPLMTNVEKDVFNSIDKEVIMNHHQIYEKSHSNCKCFLYRKIFFCKFFIYGIAI